MKKFLSLALTLLAFAIGVSAQVQVTGSVVDAENNESLPGATIVEKGTTNGTVTDMDGRFTLTTQSQSGIIIVSFVGNVSQEIEFSGPTNINVGLRPDFTNIDEVMVVGYGARKKSDVTGSISSVKSSELTAFPVLDAAQALQGRASGVVVQSNNGGEPGAAINIKIRGNTSINASSSPLIVVDGFVGAVMPQPNDIESMEILKDASATAIYGSRGSNGVVLVTTKKGRSGKLRVEVNTTYSVQNTAKQLDLLNADEFATYQKAINSSYVQGPSDTDWQDLLYRAGNTQNHQFSFSGGSDKANYYASATYFKQEGVIINSDYERISFLSNIDAQVTDKLKLGFNLFGSRGTKRGVPTQSTGETANGGGMMWFP